LDSSAPVAASRTAAPAPARNAAFFGASLAASKRCACFAAFERGATDTSNAEHADGQKTKPWDADGTA
jgi:hypothetical protein